MTEYDFSDRYMFNTEWFDEEAGLMRKFFLYYFPADNTVELYDLKVNKTYLKRTTVLGIRFEEFYPGNIITVFGRQIAIKSYGDLYSKNKLCAYTEKVFAVIKPDGMPYMGKILKLLNQKGFVLIKCKMVKMMSEQAEALFKKNDYGNVSFLVCHMITGPVLGLLLMKQNAICDLKKLIGPENSAEAKRIDPCSIRGQYGSDSIKNCIYVSQNMEEVEYVNKNTEHSDLFFPANPNPCTDLLSAAVFKNSTLCIIKPHAVRYSMSGDIVNSIIDCNFKITAMQMFHMSTPNTEEFYEVYKGVVPDYKGMVTQLTSGPCIALEITTEDYNPDTPTMFRRFAGPPDPDLARQMRPNTLRAKYGVNKIENAIHVTDLPEDAIPEVEYFFKILQNI